MARLHQTRVGFKQMHSLENPGKRVKSVTIKKGNSNVQVKKKVINKAKANEFYSTLKERDKLIFESLIRNIETKTNMALEDIFVEVRFELKNKYNYEINSGIVRSIYAKAAKLKIISSL